jgi:hypothetical protein
MLQAAGIITRRPRQSSLFMPDRRSIGPSDDGLPAPIDQFNILIIRKI